MQITNKGSLQKLSCKLCINSKGKVVQRKNGLGFKYFKAFYQTQTCYLLQLYNIILTLTNASSEYQKCFLHIKCLHNTSKR